MVIERQLPPPPPGTTLDEREALTSFLDYHRAVLARKVVGVDSVGLRATLGASSLTLGGLIKHMAWVEDYWFVVMLAGGAPSEPWASAPWEASPDWELTLADDDTADRLLDQFDRACRTSREIAANHVLSDVGLTEERRGAAVNLRWMLIHMIEEYARHCGHADLLRESIDGSVGD